MIKRAMIVIGLVQMLSVGVGQAWVDPICPNGELPVMDGGIEGSLCPKSPQTKYTPKCKDPNHTVHIIYCLAGQCARCMTDSEWNNLQSYIKAK